VFVAMVTNRYKSSPAVAHGTSTKFGARLCLLTTIHSVSENENTVFPSIEAGPRIQAGGLT